MKVTSFDFKGNFNWRIAQPHDHFWYFISASASAPRFSMTAWWENLKNCLMILENLSMRKHLNQIKCQVEKKCLSTIEYRACFHHASLSTQSQGNRNSWFFNRSSGSSWKWNHKFFALKIHLDRKQDCPYGFWKYSEEKLKNYTEELKTKFNKTKLNVVWWWYHSHPNTYYSFAKSCGKHSFN